MKRPTIKQRAAAALAATALLLGAGTAAASAMTQSVPYKVPSSTGAYWCPVYIYFWYTPEEKAAGSVDGWKFAYWEPCVVG